MGIYENARERTRQKITQAFWQLYKEQPIGKITVKSITDHSDIHRATFYLHFRDPYDILEHIEQDLIESLAHIDVHSVHSDEDITEYFRKLSSLFANNHDYLHILLRKQRDPDFSLHYKSQLISKLRALYKVKDSQDAKENAIIHMILSAIADMIITWADEAPFSFEEMILLIRGMIMDGVYMTLKNKFGITPIVDPLSLFEPKQSPNEPID